MKPPRIGVHNLLYYGEVFGVLIAWLVGVAAMLSAGGADEPVAQSERYADISLSSPDSED